MRHLGGPAVVLALSLVGCGGGGGDEPRAVPEPEETTGGMLPAMAADPLGDAEQVGIEGVQVSIPEDWGTSDQDGSLCIHPPERGECRYGSFMLFPHASDRQARDWPADHFDDDDGWAPRHHRCRSAETAGEERSTERIEDSRLASSGFVDHEDGRTSHASVWEVTCRNGDTFEVRMWYLPQSDVAAYVWSVDPRYDEVYDAIAASMDVDDYA